MVEVYIGLIDQYQTGCVGICSKNGTVCVTPCLALALPREARIAGHDLRGSGAHRAADTAGRACCYGPHSGKFCPCYPAATTSGEGGSSAHGRRATHERRRHASPGAPTPPVAPRAVTAPRPRQYHSPRPIGVRLVGRVTPAVDSPGQPQLRPPAPGTSKCFVHATAPVSISRHTNCSRLPRDVARRRIELRSIAADGSSLSDSRATCPIFGHPLKAKTGFLQRFRA